MAKTEILRYRVKFFLAEDVREEVNGKVTAVGLFPNDTVVMQVPSSTDEPTKDAAWAVSSLCILASIEGPAGPLKVDPALAMPSAAGSVRFSPNPAMALESGRAINVIAKMAPFPVSALGEFTYELAINGEVHTYAFRVVRGDGLPSATPASVSRKASRPRRTATKA